ncbi:MAG: adenosine deaminase [Candidatus Nanopelagicales bacterium]
MLTFDQIKTLPKAVLHDHLDGGLRPATLAELAAETGYPNLPTSDPIELAKWIRDACDSGSLETYLETFQHTVGVMQSFATIERVAYECAVDHANDGVVYAEIRFAPELHQSNGLSLDEIVDAVVTGFARGEKDMAATGKPIVVRTLLTAMRTAARSTEIAELAIRWRNRGVVGFDIAGKEAGYPPSRHLDAFDEIHRANFHMTIHAGEAFGLPSIWEAVQVCGADRLGHGVRIIDDIKLAADGKYEMGELAHYVRDKRVPLELCPVSNVHTGAAKSIAEHPITTLTKLGFRATVNTDNRLMSQTSMSNEMYLLHTEAGFTLEQLRWLTINAMKSAFIPFDQRLAIINDIVKPGYAAAIAKYS